MALNSQLTAINGAKNGSPSYSYRSLLFYSPQICGE